jgi:RNA polymerase sigma-70 factor (ECF subfamily)
MHTRQSHPDGALHLKAFIAEHNDRLTHILRSYVLRMGLAAQDTALVTALDLLNEVVLIALDNADRFDPGRSAMGWMLGIAANLIKRRQAVLNTLERREPLALDLIGNADEALSDEEVFDRLAGLATSTADSWFERQAELHMLVAGLSADDQRVLRLAVNHDMDGAALAQALGIQPGAARMRLFRAIRRLREAWLAQEGDV